MTMEPVALPIVDADVRATWPRPLADLVDRLVDDACHTGHAPEYYQDLDILSLENAVLEHLEGHLVRARHSTRLLDHEKDAIRAQGLRLLNAGLVNDRLDQAHDLGHLTDAEYETLRSVNETVPEHRGWGRREDQVCLTMSIAPMTYNIGGIHRLLTYWGGEAIYWQHCEGRPQSCREAPEPGDAGGRHRAPRPQRPRTSDSQRLPLGGPRVRRQGPRPRNG
ncbi:hypothetical protein [Streptomyces sp. NBC_01750]|uniref:hypothetical protein n=1 Tax=Streptomyces sp. NBC_01750 TaxID=2975928 RepID=UPI002DD84996|nr:hypothetical protein [Streptomyces sp. NBC_01750]WSD30569.1 hypothetical protein OG966_00365 [Streptomyces sp. NBC_01750]